jgi:hypothetical protein
MDDDTKIAVASLAFGALLIGLMVAISLWMASIKCHAQWEGSGMKTEWRLIGGCKVQRKDGTWVPASAVRDLAP